MRDGNSPTPDEGQGTGSGGTPPTGSEPGSVHVIMHSDRTRIVLSGEVDADLSADLAEATSDAEATALPIEVDAQHVTFMDSSGIAFLARLATRSADRVRVIRAPEAVRFLLDVTRIGELLDVVDEPDDEGTSTTEPAAHGLPTIGPGGRTDRGRPGPDDVA